MAKNKKTSKKKQSGAKKQSGGKRRAVKKNATSKKMTARKTPEKKKLLKKNSVKKKAGATPQRTKQKTGARRSGLPAPGKAPLTRSVRGKSENVDTVVFEPKGLGARSGGQSGDLQGLSDRESANSESVGELLEEGNAFEAEVVQGMENARDADEGEVTTHE